MVPVHKREEFFTNKWVYVERGRSLVAKLKAVPAEVEAECKKAGAHVVRVATLSESCCVLRIF